MKYLLTENNSEDALRKTNSEHFLNHEHKLNGLNISEKNLGCLKVNSETFLRGLSPNTLTVDTVKVL